MKPSPKTSVTRRVVSPARCARVCSAWRRPARTPTTPTVCATTATTWTSSRSGVNPAPSVLKARACCSAVSSTTTRCARSATGTPTRTRRVLGSPASPAPPVTKGRCYNPAPHSQIQFVKVWRLVHCEVCIPSQCTCNVLWSPALHVWDVSLLRHTRFEWAGHYQVCWSEESSETWGAQVEKHCRSLSCLDRSKLANNIQAALCINMSRKRCFKQAYISSVSVLWAVIAPAVKLSNLSNVRFILIFWGCYDWL